MSWNGALTRTFNKASSQAIVFFIFFLSFLSFILFYFIFCSQCNVSDWTSFAVTCGLCPITIQSSHEACLVRTILLRAVGSVTHVTSRSSGVGELKQFVDPNKTLLCGLINAYEHDALTVPPLAFKFWAGLSLAKLAGYLLAFIDVSSSRPFWCLIKIPK